MFRLLLIISCLLLGITAVFSQEPPFITNHPASGNKCIGDNITLNVIAEGEGDLLYEWYKDGDVLIGEESDQLVISNLTGDDTGVYFCRVTNDNGSTDSNPAQLIVSLDAPPPMTVNAQHNLMCENTSNYLTVDPSGEPGVSYTWYLNGNIAGYSPYYNISNASASDQGEYYNYATNACGYAYSDTVTIDFVANANIIIPPTNQTACEGEQVTFIGEAEGDELYYMWLKNGHMIIGEYSTTLTVDNLTYPNDNDAYRFIAYNMCNNDTSNSVYITVNNLPQVYGNPLDSEACVGEEITLNAYAGGTTPPTYQWYDENGILENETETELSITITEGLKYYHCLITNVCGTVSTDTAEIIPLMPLYFTQEPNDTVLCVGDDADLMIKVNGSGPFSFNWLFNDSDIFNPSISGVNTDVLSISEITVGMEGYYSCVVSNVCGSIVSDPVYVTVNTLPEVILQPVSDEVCENEEILTDFIFSGTEPIDFEWHMIGSSEVVSEDSQLYFEFAMPENSGEYFCILTNTCGSISTDTILINVLELPKILEQPISIETCSDEFLEISVTATGTEPLSYLWYRNGSALSNQTESTIIYENATVANSGEYFCRISNMCATIDSDTVSIMVGTSPAITWHPVAQNLCENQELNIIMGVSGENYHLQWFHNNEPIQGQNDTVLNIASIGLEHDGYYYCSAFNACDTVFTDTVYVQVSPAPNIDLGEDIHLCEGETTVINAGGDYVHYNWNNGLSNQPQIEVALSGTYILEVTGENSCTNRDTIIVEFHPYHNIAFNTDSTVSCGPLMLDAGESAYSYTWSTGEQESHYITVTETGFYAVTATGDHFGCESYASVYVDVREPISISLGPDVSAPVNTSINIGVEAIYEEYLWSTGFTGPQLTLFGEDYGQGTHEFWLTAFAENGCHDTDTINVTFTEPSNIENILQNNLVRIYPNPATEILFFESNKANLAKVEIYNAIGTLTYSNRNINSKTHEVCVRSFRSGMYLINTYLNNGTRSVSKVVIQ